MAMEISPVSTWIRAPRHALTLAALATIVACVATNREANQAPGTLRSPLGSYLAARHAQVERDYGSAARFLDHALATDSSNYDLVRRTFLLRLSEGRFAD